MDRERSPVRVARTQARVGEPASGVLDSLPCSAPPSAGMLGPTATSNILGRVRRPGHVGAFISACSSTWRICWAAPLTLVTVKGIAARVAPLPSSARRQACLSDRPNLVAGAILVFLCSTTWIASPRMSLGYTAGMDQPGLSRATASCSTRRCARLREASSAEALL